MEINKKQYSKMVEKATPPSPKLRDFVLSFTVGGIICVIGQLLGELYGMLGLGNNEITALIPVSLIFLAVFFTTVKLFDKIAKYAGAGTLVPITGFANAVASSAIEFKAEGFVLGVGANMFKIAGPVIAYGTIASVVYGVVYWVTTLF